MEEVERFFQSLVGKRVLLGLDDKLILKEAKDGCFIVNFMHKLLDGSRVFPFLVQSIWNPCVPTKVGFFAWEASWGKILMLDQLKKRDEF